MQSDGWPDVDDNEEYDVYNEQHVQQAKAVILNWIKDLKAQPEVIVQCHSHYF